jgi:hypothetical protein
MRNRVVKVGERPDPFGNFRELPDGAWSGEQGRHAARPARTKLKALRVPGRCVPNSLSRRRLSATQSNPLGRVDSIVLRSCDATNRCFARGASAMVVLSTATIFVLPER